jgi:predicted AAA+ superfamily ATPase
MLIPRHAFSIVESALNRQAAVALIGPRQVGKTTLARLIGDQRQAVYLDLENQEDLLNIETLDRLAGHPVIGASWEGFVLETLLSVLPWRTQPLFYRTTVGAEIDLVLERPGGELWVIEIKRGLAAKLERGFHHACEDLAPTKAFAVYSGEQRYPVADGVEAISVREMATVLAAL